jgi:hypothetical protein
MAAVVALMLMPAASQAACYSSTPSDQAIIDSPVDGDAGLAPEMAGVGISVGAACGVSFDPVITNRPVDLIDGDGVGIYIDTDGNPATGSPTFNGADRVILTAGLTGPDLPPALGVWNGITFAFSAAPFLPPVGEAGGAASMDQLGIAAPGSIGVRAAAIWHGIGTYADFAPEPFVAPFTMPVSFSTQPPPAPAPVAAAAPAPAPAAAPQSAVLATKKTGSCRVPAVRGMTAAKARARLRTAGCRYTLRAVASKVREGRVISTSKAAGSRTSSTIVVKVSRGHHAARVRAASVVDPVALYARVNNRLTAAQEAGAR